MDDYSNSLNVQGNIAQERPTPLLFNTASFYRSRLYTTDIGVNPLLAASDHIFSLVAVLREEVAPDDFARFFKELIHEIKAFDHKAQAANYHEQAVVMARYVLCALLDELIISKWQNNGYPGESLLKVFHQDDSGGERFFVIVDDSLKNIRDRVDLLELIYLSLKLGFIGKYRNRLDELDQIANQLYQVITQYRSNARKNLLVQDKTHENQVVIARKPVHDRIFSVALVAVTLLTVVAIYLGTSLKLNRELAESYSVVNTFGD